MSELWFSKSHILNYHIAFHALQKNTLPWWYVFVTVGRVFCHACTSMTILWQNQDSHTCAVVEVFHNFTKIIITEVCTSMTINRASQKCFRQGWPTCGIHRNGTPLSYRSGFGSDNPLTAPTNGKFPRVKFLLAGRNTCQLVSGSDRRLWYVNMCHGPPLAHLAYKGWPIWLGQKFAGWPMKSLLTASSQIAHFTPR